MAQQLNLPLKSSQSYAASDFYVTPANQEAHAYMTAWPHWPHFCCILYGESGSGKTHLSHLFQEKSGALSADLSAPLGETHLILDDLNLQGGMTDAQEETLFHLYNAQKGAGKNLLLLTNTAPAAWSLRLPDLSSRLRGAPSIQVHPPDDALLSQVYAKLFADHQASPNPQVIDYIVKNTERSFKTAPDLVTQAVTQALSQRRNITIPLIKEILK